MRSRVRRPASAQRSAGLWDLLGLNRGPGERWGYRQVSCCKAFTEFHMNIWASGITAFSSDQQEGTKTFQSLSCSPAGRLLFWNTQTTLINLSIFQFLALANTRNRKMILEIFIASSKRLISKFDFSWPLLLHLHMILSTFFVSLYLTLEAIKLEAGMGGRNICPGKI